MTELLECLFSCDLKKLRAIFNKIDVNCVLPGTDGCTPLHIIAGIEKTVNKENLIFFLLEKGADPNARSCENLTPVHIAAMWDNCFELEKLLQNGGNPWLTDNENKNAFDMAADNHAYEAFQLLNIYLAQDKLNFRNAKKIFESPNEHIVEIQEYGEHNNTDNPKHQTLSSTMFTTANENLPFIFSSSIDEENDLTLNMSKYIKKKSFSRQKLNKQTEKWENFNSSDSTVTEKSPKQVDNLPSKSVSKQNMNSTKNPKSVLNHAFSSTEGETSDATSLLELYLNNSNNNNNETIIEKDDQNGIVLVETRSNVDNSNSSINSNASSWKSYESENSDSSTLSYCSSHSKKPVIISDDLKEYSNSMIYDELMQLGDKPGPVLDHTRQVYLLRLARLRSGCYVFCDLPKPKYCPEIYSFLENKLDMARARSLEEIMAAEFDVDSETKWREGNLRCCFNYFLLDPRVTQNLPSRSSNLTNMQIFLTFLDSLFYIGKGTKGRPNNHLFEAAKSSKTGLGKNDKINQILEIWQAGFGVISLHCFQNSKPVEAYTREACIIEAVGLTNLTNIKKGDYYGSSARLTTSRKRMVGISLLNRALQIFLLEGERQIRPRDIQNK